MPFGVITVIHNVNSDLVLAYLGFRKECTLEVICISEVGTINFLGGSLKRI